MTVRFVAFDPDHAMRIRLQPSQHVELGLSRPLTTREEAEQLADAGPAWTALDGDRVVAIAGFAEIFPPVHALAWSMLSDDIGRAHPAITRYARARVEEMPYRRIDLITADSEPARRWAELLGFRRGHTLEAYGAASETCVLYERIRA